MNASVRAWTNGFATITSRNKAERLRYQSELTIGQLCEDCNTIRPPREF